MNKPPPLKSLSDDELLRGLSELLQKSRRVEAELIAHLAEVDERRLYARQASSMFVYCTEVLHLAEHEAYLRIKAARASREHPVLLEMLADGRLHLSGIVILRPHLTDANRKTLLQRATYKSKRQIEELVAELDPKPDVPATMRKLPIREKKSRSSSSEQVPEPVQSSNSETTKKPPETGEEPATPPVPRSNRRSVVEPLSPATYKVQFTASTELRNKLERLQALMRSSGSDGDLASVIEAAVTEKLEKLESKRYGKTKAPRKSLEETDTSPSSRYIPAPIKRAVYERDKGQCAFRDHKGRRCTETKRLEFHHRHPYGRRGDHHPDNLELRCRAHNLYDAERDYGKDVMDRYRRSGSRVSELGAVYAFSNRTTSASDVAVPS